jgi:hypothetical protein
MRGDLEKKDDEEDSDVEDKTFEKPAETDAEKREKVRKRLTRAGALSMASFMPDEPTLKQIAIFCATVVKRETDKLPTSDAEMRMARRRLPKNRTESLLRSGMEFDDVVRLAALNVLEQWVRALLKHVQRRSMVRTLASIVHGDGKPLPKSRSLRRVSVECGFDTEMNLVLYPNPTPPADTPMGSSLRRLVPADGRGRCEYVEDIMDALALEEDFNPESPTHILRPNTAMRSELALQQWNENVLDSRVKPECMKEKDDAERGRARAKNSPARRAAFGTAATIRLSGNTGGWSTFSPSDGYRMTVYHYTPQVIRESQSNSGAIPGPGTYKRPVSSMRPTRVSSYPSVGKLRSVGHAAMCSTSERFR